MSMNLVTLLYLVASVCFIQALKGLSHPTTSIRGNLFGMVGMAIAAGRQIVNNHVLFTQGAEKWLHAGNVGTFTLYGQTVGFIGYGGLARCLKPLLAPFGCPILAYDPWLPQTYLASQGVQPTDLETLLATAKVIFVLAIPSAENKALLDRARLDRRLPDQRPPGADRGGQGRD